jgi:hypothetical protein
MNRGEVDPETRMKFSEFFKVALVPIREMARISPASPRTKFDILG